MKKTAENRYPSSVTLFNFCKEALNLKYEGNVKVIDQDVGAILGYDPADCSHWKKGKKNIRSLSSLKSIANHLNIDERLLIDIAAGKVNLDEALFEFKGYGAFSLDNSTLDTIKKDYFKNPQRWTSEPSTTVKSFEEVFEIKRSAVIAAAKLLLAKGQFTEAPIYVPELYKLCSGVVLEEREETTQDAVVVTTKTGEDGISQTIVGYRKGEMRPYLRFLLVKYLYRHLIATRDSIVAGLADSPAEVQDIQANIFAANILIPDEMLRSEVAQFDTSIDLVTQLSATFWVSKILVNQRLRDYLGRGA